MCSDCECSNQQPSALHVQPESKSLFQRSLRGFSRSRNEDGSNCQRTLRLATMNVALFSLAPVVPETERFSSFNPTFNSAPTPPLAALLLEPISPPFSISKPLQSEVLSHRHRQRAKLNPAFSPNPFYSFHSSPCIEFGTKVELQLNNMRSTSIFEVLRDSQADLIALQEVKAEEERGMSPLSDLAKSLGMHFAYAESWAPEFGNAILSRWPIKSSSVKKIYNTSDYRNLLKVVVDVPSFGEVHFICTHLDHLDEDWRLKQVSSILEDCKKQPHFLAGNLNSLNRSDYSQDRWLEITQLRAENRKMAPRGDVMERLLVENNYLDAATASDSQSSPVLVRGQETQGTCKHNTRIDYILASTNLPYGFVPGTYKVLSSRGTSDHRLVTVDVGKASNIK